MTNTSKNYHAALEKVDRAKNYPLAEAMTLARGVAHAKFDETVELAVRVGVDPRKADQTFAETVILPHGTGKSVRSCPPKGRRQKKPRLLVLMLSVGTNW
jgi:large subunit ribosomal protein L1